MEQCCRTQTGERSHQALQWRACWSACQARTIVAPGDAAPEFKGVRKGIWTVSIRVATAATFVSPCRRRLHAKTECACHFVVIRSWQIFRLKVSMRVVKDRLRPGTILFHVRKSPPERFGKLSDAFEQAPTVEVIASSSGGSFHRRFHRPLSQANGPQVGGAVARSTSGGMSGLLLDSFNSCRD
jgi:hypothetical protein